MMSSVRRWVPYLTVLTFATFGTIATFNFFHFHNKTASLSVGLSESFYGCEELPLWQSQLQQRANFPPIAGHRPPTKKFLTIGIATVFREENYIQKTLQSLVDESEPEERKDASVIIYLADTDSERKEKQLRLIQNHFTEHLNSGFFQVIESTADIYPPMDFALTKRTFNDSVDRVIWRTKQVIDFAFLFSYAKGLSSYYLVIEDDVITSNQYITAVRDFVERKKAQRWVALQFSGFLGIGLLFRTADLQKLVRLLVMFHQEQPVDMLMREFITLQVPEENLVTRRIPSIFQHIGIKSTLPNKVQKLKDNTFDMARRKYKNRNPSADLMTTMKVYNEYIPEYSYRSAPGFFWGIAKPKDTFDIVFPEPISLSRVVIISGIFTTTSGSSRAKRKRKDWIQDGTLLVSPKFHTVAPNNSAICDEFDSLATFSDGQADHFMNMTSNIVQCVRIKLGPGQISWVIISEIELFQ